MRYGITRKLPNSPTAHRNANSVLQAASKVEGLTHAVQPRPVRQLCLQLSSGALPPIPPVLGLGSVLAAFQMKATEPGKLHLTDYRLEQKLHGQNVLPQE